MEFQQQPHARKMWGSRFGFLMAMIGSAVGLGNLWRFPYVAGQNGGAIFLIMYIVMVALIGFTVMSAEIAIGRNAHANVITAFGKHKKNWSLLGVFAVVICFVIVCYYNIIGGWLLRYMAGYIGGGGFVSGTTDYQGVFNGFLATPWQTILCLTAFLLLSIGVIILGVKKGIEKVSKIMMPALFVMLLFVTVVSLTMNGAGAGVKYFLVPDWETMEASGGIGGVISAAMSQAFFSLSVGMGISATYGSYVKKEENIPKNTLLVCVSDTLVAVIAGFAILPAVFASGQEPAAGAGLVFATLPAVFHQLGAFGVVVGVVFFLLIFFAAITSTMSLFEVVVAAISEKLGIKRLWASLIVAGAALVIGILICLSQAGLMGKADLFNIFDTAANVVMIPLSALLICVYVGYVWKPKNAVFEMTNEGTVKFSLAKAWTVAIKFVAPVLILFIFLTGILGLFGIGF